MPRAAAAALASCKLFVMACRCSIARQSLRWRVHRRILPAVRSTAPPTHPPRWSNVGVTRCLLIRRPASRRPLLPAGACQHAPLPWLPAGRLLPWQPPPRLQRPIPLLMALLLLPLPQRQQRPLVPLAKQMPGRQLLQLQRRQKQSTPHTLLPPLQPSTTSCSGGPPIQQPPPQPRSAPLSRRRPLTTLLVAPVVPLVLACSDR
jgi:hypothetical protein